MTWGQGSNIPKRIKDQVRRRDQVCRLNYPGICTGRIEEFDHPGGLAAHGHRREAVRAASEVQGVCKPCHRYKTNQQRLIGIAEAKARRGSLSKRYRDQEKHPGAL